MVKINGIFLGNGYELYLIGEKNKTTHEVVNKFYRCIF